MNKFNDIFDSRYKQGKALFGNEPMPLVVEAIKTLKKDGKVLDLGVGDGRNAIYLLKNGFNVTGVDMSKEGLENLKEKAGNYQDKLTLINSNVLDLELTDKFDMIIGIGLLHFLEYSDIQKLMDWVQNHTESGGINIFVAKMMQNMRNNLPYIFEAGVLESFYTVPEWEIIQYEEEHRASIMARKK
ncbi:MAG: methyltransferase domain-containing protein [Candidatus Pacebacteria bacterium]|nr:methyltransferase domain-containing protein [Candidatus Paceibacterota bacterium]